MKDIKSKGFSLDNPAYLAGSQIFTAVTNIPLDRVIKKANNIRGILSEQTQMWQKVALTLGYSTYDVGLPYYGGWDAKKEIRNLGKETDRVKKIIELQDQKKEEKEEKVVIDNEEVEVVKPKESNEVKLRRQFDSIKAENKPEQVKTLTKFGLTKKEIRALRYEKDRVEKILELMNK